MNPRTVLVLFLTTATAILTAQESSNLELLEYEVPQITGYYLPVLWEDPYVRQIGRPVIDTFIGRNGEIIRTELMTSEFKDMKTLYLNAAAMQTFSPAYAAGEAIEGFYRFPMQSYCFVQRRFKDKQLIDKLPSAHFRISDNTMEQLVIFALMEDQFHFRFDVKIDKQGTIIAFDGIGDPSQRMANQYLKEFASKVKFLPAEKDGKPVNCAMKMALVFSGGNFVDKTKRLLASNLGDDARPMPEKPESGKVTIDKEYAADLYFMESGAVHRIQLMSPMSPEEAIAAIDAFRRWKLGIGDLKKLKGRAQVYFKFKKNKQQAELLSVKPGTILVMPKAKRQQAPVYPQHLKKADIQGIVLLEFVVDKGGKVLDPIPIASTHLAFTQEVLAVAEKWKFQPAEVNGKPINRRVRQPIPFRTKF